MSGEPQQPISELGASGGLSIAVDGDSRTRRTPLGYALYFPAAFLFALNGTVSKQLLLGGLEATRASQLRVSAAFVVLFLYVLITRPSAIRVPRTQWPRVLLYGVLGIAMTQWLYFVAIARLPIGVALILEFTAPIMVALWVRFAWGHPVKDRVWIALIAALFGLALVGEVWKGFTLDAIGVAAGLAAAAALSIYYLTGERLVRERDPVSLTMIGFGAASLMWAVVTPWWSFPWERIGAVQATIGAVTNISGWWLAAWMVVLGTVVPFVLVLYALRHLTASQAATIGMGEPLIASAIAWALLGEILTPVQLLGAIVVLTSVLVAERSR